MLSGRRVFALVGWVVAIVAAGCGGQTTGPGPGGGTPTTAPASATDFTKALAHTICANVGGCCSAKKLPFQEASCETAVTTIYQSKGIVPSSYDPGKGQACLDAIASATVSCDFTSALANSEACDGLTGGSPAKHAKVGEPCNATCSSTAGSSSCLSEGMALGSGGAPPAQGSCFTNDGIHCDFDTGTCMPARGLGEVCDSSAQCNSGLCGPTSLCVAKSKMGDACSFAASETCDDGLYCDGTSCVLERDVGSPCNQSSECSSHSCKSGVCADPNDSVLKLTCVQ